MSEYTKEMSKSEILIELANIRTNLLNAVNMIEAIAKNIAYKGGDEYKKCVEQIEHDIMYEPTYNQDDGSM